MFDVGFWELGLIGLISLLVIGPEKLPKVARLSGFWLGKTKSMVANVKAEISEELKAEELRQLMQQHITEEDNLTTQAREVMDEISSAGEDLKTSVEKIKHD